MEPVDALERVGTRLGADRRDIDTANFHRAVGAARPGTGWTAVPTA